MRRALLRVLSGVWLPALVVTASTFNSGLASARMRGDGIVVAGIAIENKGQRHGQTPCNLTGPYLSKPRPDELWRSHKTASPARSITLPPHVGSASCGRLCPVIRV